MFSKFKFWLANRDNLWRFKLIYTVPILIILIAADWGTKAWAVNNLETDQYKDFVPGFVNFKYLINTGAAYGMMADQPALTITIATIVTVAMIIVYLLVNNWYYTIAITFLVAGSFANLIARGWAPSTPDGVMGGVVDFLVWDFDFLGSSEYVFNLADFFVNVGIALLILDTIIYLIIYTRTYILQKDEKYYELYVIVKAEIKAAKDEFKSKRKDLKHLHDKIQAHLELNKFVNAEHQRLRKYKKQKWLDKRAEKNKD